jgi:hypothetical protein
MPLPQDIRPAFQDIQDTVVRAEEPWIERSATSRLKVLWASRESSTWAVLHNWNKGHVFRPLKHLGGAHAYIVSGKLQVRGYTNWETIEKLREDASSLKTAE